MIQTLLSKISALVLAICLFFMPLMGAYAAAGCCSHHGGVNGCNTSTNHQLCKDGTSSPSCLCNGGKANNVQKSKTTTTSSTTNTTATTAAPAAATTSTAATTSSKTKGCCSRHGGVAKCNKASGYQMCKDGTVSTTCKC